MLDEKSPVSYYAHLGVMEGTRRVENFDLATLEEDTRIVDLFTPLKITLTLVQGKYNGEIIDDESCELLEGFIEDLKEKISKIIVGNFIDYLYG